MMKDDVKRLFDEGKSYGVIAAELGITRNIVAGYCNRNGWHRDQRLTRVKLEGHRRSRPPTFSPEYRKAWAENIRRSLELVGVSMRDISNRTSIPYHRVSQALGGRLTFSAKVRDEIEAAVSTLLEKNP